MKACSNGHIDIARMLLGEFNANIDIQNTVRAIVRLVLCDDVRGYVKWLCACGSGGWECGCCYGY